MKQQKGILCLLFFCLSVISCAAPTKDSLSGGPHLSVAEQTERTRDALQEISRLSGDSRKEMLPRIEAAYIDMIGKYPESQLVYEWYNKLMFIYLMEYEPPAFEKAEMLRAQFISKYTDANAGNRIDDILADAYYRKAEWKKIMRLYTPAIKRFIELWDFMRPWDMFMYSEAKFHLGDMDEAKKGYNIVMFFFPDSPESSLSKKRLDEISGVSRDVQAEGKSEHPPNREETAGAPLRPVPQEEADAKGAAFPEEAVTLESPAPLNTVPEKVPGMKVPPPQDMDEKDVYSLQVGFFGNERNAILLVEKLKKKGYDAFVLRHMNHDEKIFYRVLIGRFHEKREAVKFAGMVLRREKMQSIIFPQAE